MNNFIIINRIISRRNQGAKNSDEKPVDSSSIGDMAFLLLIFFIVTSSFILRQGIFFSLPSPNASSIKVDNRLLIDVYPNNHGFTYNDGQVDQSTLAKILIERKRKNPGIILVIHMTEDVKFERLINTLSIAKFTGISRVSLKNYHEK